MLKNRSAAAALAALLVVGIYAAWSSLTQPITKPSAAGQYHQQSERSKDDHLSSLLWVVEWADRNDKAILALTAIGALVAAAVLAFVTAGLWRSTTRLATATVGLRDAEHEQSLEMRRANALAEQSFDLTEKQFLLSGRSADLAEKQHGLQRVRFFTEHRPRLRVRYFRIIDISDQQSLIKFAIVNVGSSEATLFSSLGKAEFFLMGNPPAPMYLGAEKVIEAPKRFPPGASEEATILLNKQSPGIIGEMASEHRALHAFGHISCADMLENVRRTAFCRRYSVALARFDILSDPDYEYED